MRRYFLDAITAVWHRHSEAITVTADKERTAASVREERLLAEIARAQDDRDSLTEAFSVQESVTGQMLTETKRDLVVALARIEELQRSVTVAQNNFEWARIRLNSVEQERAILLERVMSVRFPVPEMTREVGPAGVAAHVPRVDDDTRSALLAGLGLPLNLFDDLGDRDAEAAGLDHDDTGAVIPK